MASTNHTMPTGPEEQNTHPLTTHQPLDQTTSPSPEPHPSIHQLLAQLNAQTQHQINLLETYISHSERRQNRTSEMLELILEIRKGRGGLNQRPQRPKPHGLDPPGFGPLPVTPNLPVCTDNSDVNSSDSAVIKKVRFAGC